MNLKTLCSLFMLFFAVSAFGKSKPHYFQLKTYYYQSEAQEKRIDSYLKDAFIPALHRQGISQVGVFKPISQPAGDKLIYVFFAAADLEKMAHLDVALEKDKAHLAAGADYLNAAHDNAPYTRIEVSLMKAFKGMTKSALPKLSSPKKDRVYELRSYEAATEKLSANKIEMFDEGEIDIFSKLNFNAIFYGQVIAGSTMPNMIYMTSFENMTDRNAHWEAFGPAYEPMRIMPQYQNNVSKNVTSLLYPTDYSDY